MTKGMGTIHPVGFLVLLFLHASISRAQQSPPSDECLLIVEQELVSPRYFQMVTDYRMAAYTSALAELRRTSHDEITRAVKALEDSDKKDDSEIHFPTDRCIQAAAMIHTDSILLREDGKPDRMAGFHLELAERLTELIRHKEARDDFHRNWLLLVGYYFQSIVYNQGGKTPFLAARTFYDKAVKRFPNDAEILLAAGTLYEWNGSFPTGEKSFLKKAEKLYGRARAVVPDTSEIELRYGRVLDKLGKYDEASQPLKKVLELDADAFHPYVAHLILGSIAERNDQFLPAIDHYETAVELLPSWQVAYLALGHAFHVSGRQKESSEVIEFATLLEPVTSRDLNGWLVYESGMTDRLDPLWLEMRNGVTF